MVTPTISLGFSPYTLVYEKETILPPNIMLPSLQLAQASRGSDSEILQSRINTLLKLEESRQRQKIDSINIRILSRDGSTNENLVRGTLK